MRALCLAACLLVGGCAAASGSDSDESGQAQHNGFYGGIGGGLSGQMGH
jgi:hypothetical protein